MNSSRKFGWIPDVPDHRDLLLRSSPLRYRVPTGPVRSSVPPLGIGMAVEDQGSLGSCTGHAVTAMLELNTILLRDELLPRNRDLSRLMAYYLGREIEGTTKIDVGCSIRNVIKGVTRKGVCDEKLWPYEEKRLTVKKISAAQTASAEKVRENIAGARFQYVRVTGLYDLKRVLASGFTVAFGFAVPETIDDITARKNTLALPTRKTKMVGGHAVLAVGYTPTSVIVRNSWGKDWGDAGHFKLPFSWWRDYRGLVDDQWVLAPMQST